MVKPLPQTSQHASIESVMRAEPDVMFCPMGMDCDGAAEIVSDSGGMRCLRFPSFKGGRDLFLAPKMSAHAGAWVRKGARPVANVGEDHETKQLRKLLRSMRISVFRCLDDVVRFFRFALYPHK